ncbi:MAG: hypothetical protein LC768_11540 [Acidobacteria bacterium]|nr:hypothetical protein [Acidobacteriota bacterium]
MKTDQQHNEKVENAEIANQGLKPNKALFSARRKTAGVSQSFTRQRLDVGA